MPCPRLAFLGCLVCAVSVSAAEEPSKPKRPISPHMAAVLASKLPAYAPTKRAEAKTPAVPALLNNDAPVDPNIVQLPKMIINDEKIIPTEAVLTEAAREQLAMDRYLGGVDGLDRGFLNRFQIRQLWDKIPLLRRIQTPFFLTNGQRAMIKYREDKAVRQREEMRDLTRLLHLSEPAPVK
jgi:hypothetical protein